MNGLNEHLKSFDSKNPDQLPDIIANIFETLSGVPEVILQDFEGVDEADLVRATPARAERVQGGELAVDPTPEAAIVDAVVVLRALESICLQFDRAVEGDGPEDLENAWRTSDGRHYVIRRTRSVAAMNGKPISRRALLSHRVLPTVAKGLRVRLIRTPNLADAAATLRLRYGAVRNYGAAFFPNLSVELSPGTGDFTVLGVSGFAPAPLIEKQLQTGRREACSGIVWGELTMPDESVALVQTGLEDGGLSEGVSPDFVIAGSWHREVDGRIHNVGVILDGSGGKLFSVNKWAKFRIGARREGIIQGAEIPILVTEDQLAVIAICRDFLQDGEEAPYCALNVDLALVPSMSATLEDLGTMAGHAATANTMRVRFGTQTLVVQQPAAPSTGGVGKVMAFPDRPLEAPQGETISTDWHLCPLAGR